MVEGLELGRCQVMKGGVSAIGVVVGFDAGEEAGSGVGPVDDAAALEHLSLEVLLEEPPLQHFSFRNSFPSLTDRAESPDTSAAAPAIRSAE